jgi:hypothetical protein
MRTFLILVIATATAQADDFAPHLSGELRDHGGVHVARLGGGVRYGHLEFDVLLDPLFWLDDTSTSDATVAWRFDKGAAIHAGWRETLVGVGGGTRVFDSAVVGASLPITGQAVQLRAGIELATLVVAHGDDMPSQWISFDSGRRFIDSYGVDLFLQVRYGH